MGNARKLFSSVHDYSYWMVPPHQVLIIGVLVICLAPSVHAYDVALKNGAVIHFQKYRVSGNQLIYVSEDGKEASIPLSEIDLLATRQKNEQANAPLALPGLYPTPLGDVARQLNLKPNIDPKGYVFTDDDFPASPPPREITKVTTSNPSPAANTTTASSDFASSKARLEQFLRKTGRLTEQHYAARILGPGLAEIEFPNRSEWQSRIYAAHRRYLADARLCISDRVSDMGPRRDQACYRLDGDKAAVQLMRDQGKQAAHEWKTQQEKFPPA